jgi:hypothetical protein
LSGVTGQVGGDDVSGLRSRGRHSGSRHRVRAVRKRDRRNQFGRAELRGAIDRRFTVDRLALDFGDTARLLQLPADICRRLLDELVAKGCLEQTNAGLFQARRP